MFQNDLYVVRDFDKGTQVIFRQIAKSGTVKIFNSLGEIVGEIKTVDLIEKIREARLPFDEPNRSK